MSDDFQTAYRNKMQGDGLRAAIERYSNAADGLTYADVDEAEKRVTEAHRALAQWLDPETYAKGCIINAKLFSSIRDSIESGRKVQSTMLFLWAGMTIVFFILSITRGAAWSDAVSSALFATGYFIVRWRHSVFLKTRFGKKQGA